MAAQDEADGAQGEGRGLKRGRPGRRPGGVTISLGAGAKPPRSRLDLARLKAVADRAVVGAGLYGEVNLVLTGDDELRRLNREFRGIDAPTDVLSFDLRDEPRDGAAGEVYISLPFACRRAARRKTSFQREVLHLAVHGILHIAGHDHVTDEEWQGMERETRKYLKA